MAKKLMYICLYLILVNETIIGNWDQFELMRLWDGSKSQFWQNVHI